MYDLAKGGKIRDVLGLDDKPMFHHYSWVRTKEQLLLKVRCWSHNWERDWTKLVEEEFSRPFSGIDFVHGYSFLEVAPFATIDHEQKPPPTDEVEFSHVRRLNHEEVIKIDISLTYQIPYTFH